MSDYPAWICSPCGQRLGKRIPTCATFHMGECGWCAAAGVPVTEPRDYGYPAAPRPVAPATCTADDYEDGQPDELQEWADYDPDC